MNSNAVDNASLRNGFVMETKIAIPMVRMRRIVISLLLQKHVLQGNGHARITIVSLRAGDVMVMQIVVITVMKRIVVCPLYSTFFI